MLPSPLDYLHSIAHGSAVRKLNTAASFYFLRQIHNFIYTVRVQDNLIYTSLKSHDSRKWQNDQVYEAFYEV